MIYARTFDGITIELTNPIGQADKLHRLIALGEAFDDRPSGGLRGFVDTNGGSILQDPTESYYLFTRDRLLDVMAWLGEIELFALAGDCSDPDTPLGALYQGWANETRELPPIESVSADGIVFEHNRRDIDDAIVASMYGVTPATCQDRKQKRLLERAEHQQAIDDTNVAAAQKTHIQHQVVPDGLWRDGRPIPLRWRNGCQKLDELWKDGHIVPIRWRDPFTVWDDATLGPRTDDRVDPMPRVTMTVWDDVCEYTPPTIDELQEAREQFVKTAAARGWPWPRVTDQKDVDKPAKVRHSGGMGITSEFMGALKDGAADGFAQAALQTATEGIENALVTLGLPEEYAQHPGVTALIQLAGPSLLLAASSAVPDSVRPEMVTTALKAAQRAGITSVSRGASRAVMQAMMPALGKLAQLKQAEDPPEELPTVTQVD